MPGMKKMMMMKKGGKAKKKSKFPDHSGDGKITKKDILMAKRFGSEDGVITPYEEKRGKAIAKATGNEYKKGGRAKNTRRMNQLEELGRVDAEKAYTRKGKRNLKAEKKRIVRSLNSRGAAVRGHGKEIK